MAVVLLPTPPFWFTMATIVLTAGILARRLSAFLSRRPAVSWSRPPTDGDTPSLFPLLSRGSPGFAPSRRPQITWEPPLSPPPPPRAFRPPRSPPPVPLLPTSLSSRSHDHRS